MDDFPISITAGVAGALASHQVAREQLARQVRRRRVEEHHESLDELASDAPVERVDGSEPISSRLPDPSPQRRPVARRPQGEANDADAHIDVTG